MPHDKSPNEVTILLMIETP